MYIDINKFETDNAVGCSGNSDLSSLFISHSQISDLCNDQKSLIQRQKTTQGYTPRSVSTSMLWGVFSSVANESVAIRSSDKYIFERYMDTAIDMAKNGEDSGLFLPETLDGWNLLEEEEKDEVVDTLHDCVEYMYDFPHLKDLSIVMSSQSCVINIGSEELHSTIPAVTRNAKGLVSIVPIIDGSDRVSASLFSFGKNSSDGVKIPDVNIWNLKDAKISREDPNAILKVNDALTNL